MASQAILFAETIMAMKKAKKRRAYESESDSEVEHHGNRGQKLKKRSRFVHEGQLAPPSGPEMYREVIDHAGYRRAIISRNPPLYDDDGYEVDSEEDDDRIQDLLEEAADFDPYATVRIENILAPLTAVTDLPTHTTLSRPYTSTTLTELATQGCNIMHKENAALWKIKHLQTKLIGDHTWVPCELMLGEKDIEYFRDDYQETATDGKASVKSDVEMLAADKPNKQDSTSKETTRNREAGPTKAQDGIADATEADTVDTTMVDADDPAAPSDGTNGVDKPNHSSSEDTHDHDRPKTDQIADGGNNKEQFQNKSESASSDAAQAAEQSTAGIAVNGAGAVSAKGDETASSVGRPITPDTGSQYEIHPFFLAPRTARPDRDLGIPEAEAEDVRRLLQLYVQKQEEVCRGAKRLYHGLLRAERMRKTVLQWAKYEAHVGPNGDMSDGEDWYDKEEWGLDEDLKKGQDEEEEDTSQPAKKRTRTHR